MTDDNLSRYSLGKFGLNVDAFAYGQSLDGCTETVGDVTYGSHFSKVEGPFERSVHLPDRSEADLTADDWTFLSRQVGAILEENGQGFVSVDWFEDPDAFRAKWEEIESADAEENEEGENFRKFYAREKELAEEGPDFDRDEIRDGLARTLYSLCAAQAADEEPDREDIPRAGSGEDWREVLPCTPPRFLDIADAILARTSDLAEIARDWMRETGEDCDAFGHSIAGTVTGNGFGIFDDAERTPALHAFRQELGSIELHGTYATDRILEVTCSGLGQETTDRIYGLAKARIGSAAIDAMSGTEWSPDTLDEIARAIRSEGFAIDEPRTETEE